MLAAVVWLFVALMRNGAASRCADGACSPPLGNLASGRTLTTLTGCSHPQRPGPSPHPGAARDPRPTPIRPRTWPTTPSPARAPGGRRAQGAADPHAHRDEIRLDLETRFCLSHVVLVFRSPRPAAMAVERSGDFGRTWETLKLFAHNCSLEFGLPDDVMEPGATCTSRYSKATPCTGGEVIFRTLSSSSIKVMDPYSPATLARLSLTNLRIRLLKAQTCPAPLDPPGEERRVSNSTQVPTATQGLESAPYYSIYTLLARGTCLCHGHAEHCVTHNTSQGGLQDSNVVPARCVCSHHTAGGHCERCAPLYNDRPWRPANGSSGEPNACHKCECNGHADSCHFSQRAWLSSGGTSGGVCNDCRHNTMGRRCQRCRHGYHRHPFLPLNSPHACIWCWCDPQGALSLHHTEEGPWCHPRNGQCSCKAGVGGVKCSQCLPGYWGFGEEGCQPCVCPQACDPNTGQCLDSYTDNQVVNVPIGGRIPDLEHMFTHEGEAVWPKELAVSALHYTGKCTCKEKKMRSLSDLCKTKHDYVIKVSVLSAHDKGSHAEVQVKVRKVLRSGQVPLSLGTISVYPLTWTSRGCTCPILNPGMDYLLAGPEEHETGRLLVTLQSVVALWTPRLGLNLSQGLRNECP
ncbi:Netrin-4 [Merluccius polli]|uniref:Netrin-4 n=1 Tax=Merluccius polli TaxID=89951 RepID=A0AA47PAI6_MERPO|nr:Netrin-4 [Merluccius polli]